MRVFVTGATGFVGSAVVEDLLAAGHQVIGLVRSDDAAAKLKAAGAEAHRGDLDDIESLRSAIARADGIIHTAFNHDFSRYRENCESDRRVIIALGEALAGSDRPLIVTSGTGIVGQGAITTEAMVPADSTVGHPRAASEEAARLLLQRGVRATIVRLPPSVHGDGDHGFVPMLIAVARQKGCSARLAEGENRWPAVHRRDAARLFRLALERGVPDVYHAAAEEGVAFAEIADVIGQRLGLPVVSLSKDEAENHFGWFAGFATMDAPTSSTQTRRLLQWQPTQPGLIADIDRPGYFAT